ncbi:NAD(P)/FAD-dependent oxidoreductase [Bordetella bronchiseptica]|uniref:NAD(P)/FAD-dependent oxidoreductase n=1 Tax=Bordetella bronchiseptica TaxID=518 RepID=UPI00081C5767|nr:NAD(P)/FAD-dependent oxidoreductase [Bordetella bronchiseptica]AOB28708.1 oxidoreductase [Bordetella bronchiseptica]AZW46059.1 NAD(P)/FAD-dependent oxidoreductase [Bordetella bronchiseptica]
MRQFYDAVIVGGGPAGASCAIWLARLGLAPLLVEAGERLGGLGNDNPFTDDWIAVLPNVTGQQAAANIAASVAAAGVPVRLGAPATAVRPCKGGVEVRLGGDGRDAVYGKSLVIASGVRARGLPGHPQQARWPGVLIGPGSPIVAQDYAGLSVAVLGGGDNAFENFVYVRNRGARRVDLYARTVRAQQQWVARAGVDGVRVGPYRVDPAARTVDGRPYDLILVFYGWEPQAAFADSLNLERDSRGYLRTDFATAQTSLPDVYAIGEVAHRMHPCVVTSLADGVVAAKAIQRRWERPAPSR